MKLLYLPHAYSQQRQREKKANIYPVRLAMEAEWHRRNGDEVYWGLGNFIEVLLGNNKQYILYNEGEIKTLDFDKVISEPEGLPFLSLPAPDRVFTRAKEYTSGNYKYLPGTHILSASGCWHGKCSFCVEKNVKYEVRPVDDVIKEIEQCKKEGYREIFDDSASFPVGSWLDDFCSYLSRTRNGRDNRTRFGCNCRLDRGYPWEKMKQADFRMVLFGLESANQETLDRINKGVKIEEAIANITRASKAGLDVHLAVMFGYPWETDKEAQNTLRLVHKLLRRGLAKTAQASFFTPGDIQSNFAHRRYVRGLYGVWRFPDFLFHQVKDIRTKEDLAYLWLKIRKGLGW